MANLEHLAKLEEGVESWNTWREDNPDINPDLSGIYLNDLDFLGIDFRSVNLSQSTLLRINFGGAVLSNATITDANLSETDFTTAQLFRTDFTNCNLTEATFLFAVLLESRLVGAILTNASLTHADLSYANLSNAVLGGADLSFARMVGTKLSEALMVESNLQGAVLIRADMINADISGSSVYGLSVWDIKSEGLRQKNLTIKPKLEGYSLTVDDIEIAQFIYLLYSNQKLRNIIETVTSKAVLILGRFTNERKQVLDAIRDELRKKDFLPILFDFEKPASRDLTETISILAKMSRFVIADLTDAKSIPQELSHIIPFSPNLPVIPIILQGQREYAMFEHWKPYPWVLPIYEYTDEAHLISTLSAGVIEPAERKVQEIRNVK